MKILLMLIAATTLAAACTQGATRMPESRSLTGAEAREFWRGWKSNDFPAGWRVDGDTLSKEGDVQDLISREIFGNFELELDWKLSEGGNAGIFYRGTREYDHIYWSAPEYQLLDDARHADGANRLTSAAAAYALYAAPAGIVKPAGEWNSARIVVNGAHVEHWLNGQKVVTYELWSPDWKAKVAASKFARYPNYGLAKEGLIGIQGDHAGTLSLRGIRIRALGPVLAPAVHAQSAASAPAAEELTKLLKYFLDGASRNDVAVHDRFWAGDLIYTRSTGVRIGKADILANAGSPEAAAEPPTAYTAEDVHIQQYDDTAIVAFRLVGTTGSGPQAEVTQFLNTGTFARRNGEWRAVAWQATRMTAPVKEAAINLTPGAVARPGLYEEILGADSEFFKAFFDTCDVETVRGYIADDFEMFHDKGGLVSSSGAEFVKVTQDKCKRQAEGTDFLSARKLVPESMKVYALNNYGAIQVGTHRFYAVQKDKPDRLTETGLFTHVWKEENGQWKLARVLSYDHVLAQ